VGGLRLQCDVVSWGPRFCGAEPALALRGPPGPPHSQWIPLTWGRGSLLPTLRTAAGGSPQSRSSPKDGGGTKSLTITFFWSGRPFYPRWISPHLVATLIQLSPPHLIDTLQYVPQRKSPVWVQTSEFRVVRCRLFVQRPESQDDWHGSEL
jgi:hypothetical protein